MEARNKARNRSAVQATTKPNSHKAPTQRLLRTAKEPTPNEPVAYDIPTDMNELTESDVETIAQSLPWLSKITAEKVATLKTLYRKQIQQQQAVSEIEDHLERNTAPKSLNIRVNAQVSKKHQEEVEAVVKSAVWTCQESILKAVLVARRADLKEVTEEITNATKSWYDKKDEYAALMLEANVPVPSIKVTQAEADFKMKCKAVLYHIRTDSVVRARKKVEQNEARQARNAERNIDQLLETDDANLQHRLNSLEKKMTGLQKKANAKPTTTKRSGKGKEGGGNAIKPTSKKSRSGEKNHEKPARSKSGKSDHPRGKKDRSDQDKKRADKRRSKQEPKRGNGNGRERNARNKKHA